jgi:hypothetical protein
MNELVPALLVVFVGLSMAAVQAARFSRHESPLLLLGFAAHMASAWAQVWLTKALYGGGDLFGYTRNGEALARLLRVDFWQFAPELLKALFHQLPNLPFDVPAVGSSTGSMYVIATFVAYLTGGSYFTLSLVVAVFGYFGKVALYRAFKASLPDEFHPRLLIAVTLIPSSIFWSSAMLKEAVAISGLGYLVWGLVRFRSSVSLIGLFQMVVGATCVGLVKGYILFPIVLAIGAWLYALSTGGKGRLLRPIPLGFAALVGFGGVVLLGKLFPQFAVDDLAEWAAYYQEMGQTVSGGSTYAFGDPTQASALGQLAFMPLALITSLFRPFLLEAQSAQVAVNALETTVLLVGWIRVFVRAGAREVIKAVFRYPLLVFSLTFTLVFAVAVGLMTTNLGTLSRYRMPLVPFFWALLLVLDRMTARVRRGSPAQAFALPRRLDASGSLPASAQRLRRPTAHQ